MLLEYGADSRSACKEGTAIVMAENMCLKDIYKTLVKWEQGASERDLLKLKSQNTHTDVVVVRDLPLEEADLKITGSWDVYREEFFPKNHLFFCLDELHYVVVVMTRPDRDGTHFGLVVDTEGKNYLLFLLIIIFTFFFFFFSQVCESLSLIEMI